ncbi:hypothetical protein [Allorhizobium sonneratiae]|uniref:hypothetical protein n=1 Tax=Allorhizobium sonneratiae TaxID=2934936 RepID=UPI003B8461FC
MSKDVERNGRQSQRATSRSARMGVINLALLFAVAAVAITLVVTPLLSDKNDSGQIASAPVELDTLATGSISTTTDQGKRYTIRRSVLQKTPGAVCIVDPSNGNNGC